MSALLLRMSPAPRAILWASPRSLSIATAHARLSLSDPPRITRSTLATRPKETWAALPSWQNNPQISRRLYSTPTQRDSPQQKATADQEIKSLKENPPTLLQSFVSYAKTLGLGLKQIVVDTGHSVKLLTKGNDLKRRDHMHLRRNKADLLAFVPFTLLLALPGTFILMPLVFKFVPTMIPSVFRTHAMAEMIEGKPEKKLAIFNAVPNDLVTALDRVLKSLPPAHQAPLKSLGQEVAELTQQFSRGGAITYEAIEKVKDVGVLLSLESFSSQQLKDYSYLLGMPSFLPKRTLSSHLAFLESDDKMVLQEGGAVSLNLAELKDALKARGYMSYTLQHGSEESLRKMLDRWIHFSVSGNPHPHLPFMRLMAIILRAR